MATSVELRHQRATVRERQKELVDRAEAENRDLTAEELNSFNAADADITALDARIERSERMERTPADNGEGRSRDIQNAERRGIPASPIELRSTPEYKAAGMRWMREGMAALTPEEREMLTKGVDMRALSTVSMTAGGYTVAPNDFAAAVESAMQFYGGMREAATVITTDNGADLPFPTTNDTSNTGEIIGENGQVSQQDVTFGAVTMKAFMYSSKLVLVPFQLLQDSAIDLGSFLADKFGERIGRIQNTHFTTGAGASQPTGIVNMAAAGVSGASQTAVSADELINLQHSVDIAYRSRPGVRFMFHDQTLRDIRKLKDGNGQYLWQPGLGQGIPNTLLNTPYTVNNDMATMATGAKSILFGDLSKYIIRQVSGFTMLRLTERYADYMQVGFFGYSRADGMLIDAGGSPVKYFANA